MQVFDKLWNFNFKKKTTFYNNNFVVMINRNFYKKIFESRLNRNHKANIFSVTTSHKAREASNKRKAPERPKIAPLMKSYLTYMYTLTIINTASICHWCIPKHLIVYVPACIHMTNSSPSQLSFIVSSFSILHSAL